MRGIHLHGLASRSISTSIRLSVEDYLRIKKQARKAHLTVADYIRSKVGSAELSYWPLKE